MIKQLTIIGLGLIGGSVACAMKRANFCQRIVAYDQHIEALKKAQQLGMIDHYENTIENAAKNADLILIATPLSTFENILSSLKNIITSKTIITDVGSVKTPVIEISHKILKEKFSQFVPGHPIAGSEKSGFNAAQENLFKNHLIILTPVNETDPKATALVTLLWEKTNARVEILNAQVHDQVLAITSHLPQLLSYAFMNQIVDQSNYPEILNYTGNGFKDFTRLATSNPEIWADICLANRENILSVIENFETHLTTLHTALESRNKEALREMFYRSNKAKT